MPNSLYLRRLFAKALEGYTSELSLLLTGCQWFHTVSSFSFMKNSKFRNVHGRTFLNNGIHAAAGTADILGNFFAGAAAGIDVRIVPGMAAS
ncbi:MAG: hypothetical protein ACTTI6_09210 [Treponema sp.]|uniref:hypothetical protein n=2 Tax=Treponema sp. TaxID=166 RepID=UPI003FA31FFA